MHFPFSTDHAVSLRGGVVDVTTHGDALCSDLPNVVDGTENRCEAVAGSSRAAGSPPKQRELRERRSVEAKGAAEGANKT